MLARDQGSRIQPFSPKTSGHSGLLDMVKTYDLLSVKKDDGGNWMVSLATKGDAAG